MLSRAAMIAVLAMAVGVETGAADGDTFEYPIPVDFGSTPEFLSAPLAPVRKSSNSNRIIVSSDQSLAPEQAQLVSNAGDFDEPVQHEIAEFSSQGQDCCCDVCVPADEPHFWKSRFYPSPHCSSGDMPLHIPYIAEPKNYYYFRPYNWFHIAAQQQEVMIYGGDPRHPYANESFRDIYRHIESSSSAR